MNRYSDEFKNKNRFNETHPFYETEITVAELAEKINKSYDFVRRRLIKRKKWNAEKVYETYKGQ